MSGVTTYGDISPRTAAYVTKEFLERGIEHAILPMFGQTQPIPPNSTKSIIFRRYEALDNTPKALTEGVTPTAKKLTKTDVTANLTQYGDWMELTDVVADTHEDPVLREMIDVLAEQAPQMLEIVTYGVLKACTNRFYANGAAITDVNTPINLTFQRKITRALKRQLARPITKIVRPTVEYGTSPVAPAYIAITHTDVESDIRNMPGFIPVEQYANMTPYPHEVGKVENVRYLCSTLMAPEEDGGAAFNGSGSAMLTTGGTNADVYPILYIGRDAYATVPLRGKNAITPMVVNPKPANGDPLGQRGSVGWKTYHTAVILNDLWMAVGYVAVSENP